MAAKICGNNRNKLQVVLTKFDGEHQVTINDLLVDEGYASYINNYATTKAKMKNNPGDSMDIDSQDTPLNKLQGNISGLSILRDLVERNKMAKVDKHDSLIKVRIPEFTDPDEFYIQIDIRELNEFFTNLESQIEFYSRNALELKDLNENKCAFVCDKYFRKKWIRGYVTDKLGISSETNEQLFQVLAFDYGGRFEVPLSKIRNLKSAYKNYDSFGIKCYIMNLSPQPVGKWSLTAIDKFKEILENFKDDLYILVKTDISNESIIPIKLYYRETIIAGALEPEKIVYNNVAQKLIDEGLAKLDKSKSDENNSKEESESDDDAEINQEPDEESTMRIEMPFSFGNQDSVSKLLENFSYQNETNKIYTYLKEEYPKEKEFYGVPTYIDDNLFIYFRIWYKDGRPQPCRIIEQKISEKLIKSDRLMPFSGKFEKNNACTAYFDFDKTWNRAEILGVANVKNEGNKIIIRYVDYGNQDKVFVDKLSSVVFGPDVPKLALKCKLFNGNHFDPKRKDDLVNEVYSMIIDKECRFTWEVICSILKILFQLILYLYFRMLLNIQWKLASNLLMELI